MEATLDEDKYMVLGEVAEALGNSEAWVCRLTQQGRLPYMTTPLGRLYLREDVEKFINERKEKRTNQRADFRLVGRHVFSFRLYRQGLRRGVKLIGAGADPAASGSSGRVASVVASRSMLPPAANFGVSRHLSVTRAKVQSSSG